MNNICCCLNLYPQWRKFIQWHQAKSKQRDKYNKERVTCVVESSKYLHGIAKHDIVRHSLK